MILGYSWVDEVAGSLGYIDEPIGRFLDVSALCAPRARWRSVFIDAVCTITRVPDFASETLLRCLTDLVTYPRYDWLDKLRYSRLGSRSAGRFASRLASIYQALKSDFFFIL